MSRDGLNPGAMIAAQRISAITTIVGSIILMIFVGWLTVLWWGEGQWGWGVFGVLVIVVNLVFVVLQIKKVRTVGTKAPPRS